MATVMEKKVQVLDKTDFDGCYLVIAAIESAKTKFEEEISSLSRLIAEIRDPATQERLGRQRNDIHASLGSVFQPAYNLVAELSSIKKSAQNARQ